MTPVQIIIKEIFWATFFPSPALRAADVTRCDVGVSRWLLDTVLMYL